MEPTANRRGRAAYTRAMDTGVKIARLEEENARLRSAAEQALQAAETMMGYLPGEDQAIFQATVTSVSELLEAPASSN